MTVVFVQPVTSLVTMLDEGGKCVKLVRDILIMSVKRQSEVNYVKAWFVKKKKKKKIFVMIYLHPELQEENRPFERS